MQFEQALGELRAGKCVARARWGMLHYLLSINGFIFLAEKASATREAQAPKNWLPKPSDLLAEDWKIVTPGGADV